VYGDAECGADSERYGQLHDCGECAGCGGQLHELCVGGCDGWNDDADARGLVHAERELRERGHDCQYGGEFCADESGEHGVGADGCVADVHVDADEHWDDDVWDDGDGVGADACGLGDHGDHGRDGDEQHWGGV